MVLDKLPCFLGSQILPLFYIACGAAAEGLRIKNFAKFQHNFLFRVVVECGDFVDCQLSGRFELFAFELRPQNNICVEVYCLFEIAAFQNGGDC